MGRRRRVGTKKRVRNGEDIELPDVGQCDLRRSSTFIMGSNDLGLGAMVTVPVPVVSSG
jgi:hypothetical protein